MNDILANPNLVVLFALVAPLVTSALKNPSWSSGQKQCLAWAVSAVFGAVAVALRVQAGGITLSLDEVILHIGEIGLASQLIYRVLLHPDGLALKLNERLETVGYGTEAKRAEASQKIDELLASVAARNGFTPEERAMIGVPPTIGGNV